MLTGKKDQVIELRQKRLCSTCQDIATRVGISRERVRQILKRAGLPTLRYRAPYLCADCGKPLNRINNKSGLCLECRIKSNRVPLICDTCGKLFYRKKAEIMSQSQPHTGFFCSKSCWGTKMGNTYGFVVNPQNCRRIRKYDYDAIWQNTP
jgi:DNA-directed RNA polymerase subunit RPC12/RpoP